MGHVGGEAAHRGQAVGLAHPLLHLLDQREVLADADQPDALAASRSERPERDADRDLAPVVSRELEFVARGKFSEFVGDPAHMVQVHAPPEDGRPRLAEGIRRADTGDGRGGPVECWRHRQ